MTEATPYESSTHAFALHMSPEGVAQITFNVPDKSVNAFSRPILEDFTQLLDAVFANANLKGLVFQSGKPGSFAAGVDIDIFDTLKTAADGEQAAKTLQDLFARLENASVPTVAAIDGVCLGGGLEMALACHYRIASTDPKTKLGLPEVQLGLLPGGGGTQRLPRLIGLAESLGLILTGKQVDSKKALRLGLVDQCAPPNQLFDKAVALCLEKAPLKRKQLVSVRKDGAKVDVNKIALEGTSMGRALIRKKSEEQVQKNTKGHYPAPVKALESVMWGITRPFDEGLAHEAKLFGELVASSESRSLVHIFRIMTAAKKNPCDKDAQDAAKAAYTRPLENGETPVGIVGAGLMGSGVATVLASKGIRTVLEDRDFTGVAKGMESITDFFNDRLRKRRLKPEGKVQALASVCPSLDMRAFRNAGIVIEAVFEELSIKHDILARCEEVCPDNFIFATNTSSIPISRIAQKAKDPSRVIGMHFFSPVPKMPLVEIIKTPQTSPQVVSAVFDVGSRMGKNLIVVNDGPGFYTTRILAFYIAEALNILSEGASIEDIDKACESFGMPVGPITLLDEVGIDVGSHIIRVLKEAFGDRLVVPEAVEAVEKESRKGRKNGFGFYLYEEGRKAGVDRTIYNHFKGGQERLRLDRKDIAERCAFVFMNEAARCLDEGILRSADDGDLGAVFGLGFPPFLGGPFFHGQTLGHAHVKERLGELAGKFGKRFEPSPYWSGEPQVDRQAP